MKIIFFFFFFFLGGGGGGVRLGGGVKGGFERRSEPFVLARFGVVG